MEHYLMAAERTDAPLAPASTVTLTVFGHKKVRADVGSEALSRWYERLQT